MPPPPQAGAQPQPQPPTSSSPSPAQIDHLDNQSPVIDKIHSWEDFDISHFKLFIDLMNSREYQTSTKSRKIASIKSFIKFLLLEKIIKKNPLKDVKQPSNNPKIPYTLSSNQIETLLEYSFKKSNDKSYQALFS